MNQVAEKKSAGLPNSTKTWLMAKESCLLDAVSTFEGTNVDATCIGRPHLGAPGH